MIHIGKNTRSTIIPRHLLRMPRRGTAQLSRPRKIMKKRRERCALFSQCDSLLIGDNAARILFPYIEVKNTTRAIDAQPDLEIGEDPDMFLQPTRCATQDAC